MRSVVAFGPQSPRKLLAALGILVLGAAGVYEGSQFILTGDYLGIAAVGAACVGVAVLDRVLNDWRKGVYLFLIWLGLEDLVRKYLGNNMGVFFAKDALLAAVYLSFFMAWRRREVKFFRPPFWMAVVVFIWFGILQIFNPNSPSVWYGFLGAKIDFFYIPLFFLGYALLDHEEQLRRFFYLYAVLVVAIASLGVAQSILGATFLNPGTMQTDIRELGTLYREVPGTGEILYRPTSVFVSTGRFIDFLNLNWLLMLGFSAYLTMRRRGRRISVFLALALIAAASTLSGSRGAFGWAIINAVVVAIALVWGARLRPEQTRRAMRIVWRSALAMALALSLLVAIFPSAVASRLHLYSETLAPTSARSDLGNRAWDYPVRNFLLAFDYPEWPYGYGIGTGSLGAQYVARILHVQPTIVNVESGYGVLMLELGVAGLALWLIMTVAILRAAWRIARKLRGTPLFLIAFVIFWYAAMLLFPMTFTGMQNFQDFLLNANLWLLLGILFRLPSVASAVSASNSACQVSVRVAAPATQRNRRR
jgi:O-antigen ligase